MKRDMMADEGAARVGAAEKERSERGDGGLAQLSDQRVYARAGGGPFVSSAETEGTCDASQKRMHPIPV